MVVFVCCCRLRLGAEEEHSSLGLISWMNGSPLVLYLCLGSVDLHLFCVQLCRCRQPLYLLLWYIIEFRSNESDQSLLLYSSQKTGLLLYFSCQCFTLVIPLVIYQYWFDHIRVKFNHFSKALRVLYRDHAIQCITVVFMRWALTETVTS